MESFSKQYDPNQLPREELSEREKQLMHTHLNQERMLRWRRVAGPNPHNSVGIIRRKTIIWLAAAVLATLLLYQLNTWLSEAPEPQKQPFAMRTDLIDYPFENDAFRGGDAQQKTVRTTQTLSAYQAGDFQKALQEALPDDHFFKGVCWLQLKQAQQALDEMAQAGPQDTLKSEFLYYKGVALQDLGRNQEATIAFQQLLNKQTVREHFRKEAAYRIDSMAPIK